jgi:hypothetical protein
LKEYQTHLILNIACSNPNLKDGSSTTAIEYK